MPGLSVGMKCLKCSVFFFNIMCFMCAVLLISVGIYVQVVFSDFGPEIKEVWQSAPIVIIVVGSVILLVSFLGCCGAVKEDVCMLYTYAILLVLFFVGEIVAAALAVVFKDAVDAEIHSRLKSAVDNYSTELFKESVDNIQKLFECCGADGRGDYPQDKIPQSCKNYQEGCSQKFSQFLKSKMVIIACVGFGVCLVQLLSIIIACCLGNRIRHYENI